MDTPRGEARARRLPSTVSLLRPPHARRTHALGRLVLIRLAPPEAIRGADLAVGRGLLFVLQDGPGPERRNRCTAGFEAKGELIEADMEKLAVSKPPVEVHNRPGKSGRPVGGQESDQALQIDFCPPTPRCRTLASLTGGGGQAHIRRAQVPHPGPAGKRRPIYGLVEPGCSVSPKRGHGWRLDAVAVEIGRGYSSW